MRSYIAVAALLFALAVEMPTLQAYAEGEVLVPDDTAKSPADLGLTPSTSATPSAPTPPTNGIPMSPVSPSFADLPQNPMADTIRDMVKNMPNSPLAKSRTTQVVNIPKSDSTEPTTINVNVESKWKPRSVTLVSNQLGIKEADVPSACQISLNGIIRTDKTAAVFDTASASHVTAIYGGNMNSVMATVRALCNESTPLPANTSMVFKMGDKYVVMLGMAQCQPPNTDKPLHAISVNFSDQGVPQCTIQ